MPEPFSTVALSLCFGYASLYAYTRNESAISDEAKSARREVSAVFSSAEDSQVLFGAKSSALSELRKMVDECADDCWDGNDALGISAPAYWNAENLIRALPDNFPLPEFAPEPDGSISLDWISSRYRIFSLSAGDGNRISYAWLDGSDKGHGVAHFDGFTVPSRILSELQSFVNYGKSTIRTA